MADISTCGQDGCEERSTLRFTWPGHDEMGACDAHAEKARGVAAALGLPLQVIPLDSEEGPSCDKS